MFSNGRDFVPLGIPETCTSRKAFSPVPVRMATKTSGASSIAAKTSIISSDTCVVHAFFSLSVWLDPLRSSFRRRSLAFGHLSLLRGHFHRLVIETESRLFLKYAGHYGSSYEAICLSFE